MLSKALCAFNFSEGQWGAFVAWVAGLLCDRGWGPCGTAESDTKTCATQSTDWWLVRPLQEAQQNQVMSMLDDQIQQVCQVYPVSRTFRVKIQMLSLYCMVTRNHFNAHKICRSKFVDRLSEGVCGKWRVCCRNQKKTPVPFSAINQFVRDKMVTHKQCRLEHRAVTSNFDLVSSLHCRSN